MGKNTGAFVSTISNSLVKFLSLFSLFTLNAFSFVEFLSLFSLFPLNAFNVFPDH